MGVVVAKLASGPKSWRHNFGLSPRVIALTLRPQPRPLDHNFGLSVVLEADLIASDLRSVNGGRERVLSRPACVIAVC